MNHMHVPERAPAIELDDIFRNVPVRPSPHQMATLAVRGVTCADIVQAGERHGYHRPVMSRSLAELDAILPHIHTTTDALARQHRNAALVLFAARDAEVLYDDFALTHPNIPNRLLPASMSLWDHLKRKYAKDFLHEHGLSEAAITNRANNFAIVDSGFYGSVGWRLKETVRKQYRHNESFAGRLAVKLVCTRPGGIGQNIVGRYGLSISELPKTSNWISPEIFARMAHDLPTYPLAAAIQLMPRYHGAYTKLMRREDGRIIALPSRSAYIPRNVDNPGDYEWGINSSIVNPIAAAVMQLKTVQAALERNRPQPAKAPTPAHKTRTISDILRWIVS